MEYWEKKFPEVGNYSFQLLLSLFHLLQKGLSLPQLSRLLQKGFGEGDRRLFCQSRFPPA